VINWVRNLLGKLQEIADGKASQSDSNRSST
jgi:hypothetical protein